MMETEFVTVQHCNSLPEAYLAKQALESEGIECILLNENLNGLGQAGQAIILQVALKDETPANEIINHLNAGVKIRHGKGEFIPCPECGSQSTVILWKPPSKILLRLISIFTHDLTRAEFKCTSCGNKFDLKW